MMSLTGENSTDALPDPLSVTSRETGIGLSCTGVRLTIGSSDAEMVTGASGSVIVVAASTATEATANLAASGSPAEVSTVLSSAPMLAAGSST